MQSAIPNATVLSAADQLLMAQLIGDFASHMDDAWTAEAAALAISMLSNVAGGSLNTPDPQSASVLKEAYSALSAVTAGFSATMQVPGNSSFAFSSPNIAVMLRLEKPSDVRMRLFRVPFVSPNGAAIFEPLPEDMAPLLRRHENVLVTLVSLKWNPYASASGELKTTPVTRFTVSDFDTGAEISVRNLRTPVLFQLPAPQQLDAESDASCRFFDVGTLAFSGAGCAAAPVRLPPGVNVTWDAAAVNRTGALGANFVFQFDASEFPFCKFTVLDCSNATGPQSVIVDDLDPFGPSGIVTCPPPVANRPQPRCAHKKSQEGTIIQSVFALDDSACSHVGLTTPESLLCPGCSSSLVATGTTRKRGASSGTRHLHATGMPPCRLSKAPTASRRQRRAARARISRVRRYPTIIASQTCVDRGVLL